MKNLILLVVLMTVGYTVSAQESDSLSQETTIIFVRHAEKMDDGSENPSLNEKGKERAVKLAKLLINDFHISAIYSTPYYRTKQTAKPLADSLNIPIYEYDLSDPNHFVGKLIEDYKGQEVVVIGHSNTTPMLVNIALGTGLYESLDENSYGQIFVVHANSVWRACADVLTY
jgi:broad specificity phosphatase PhoE